MSRIGKKPVALPKGVTAEIKGQTIEVKGPKGTRSFTATDDVDLALAEGSVDYVLMFVPIEGAFSEALRAVWDGFNESDGFNALVIRAGLTWRQVSLLRAIGRYLRQAGGSWGQTSLETALVDHHEIARDLVEEAGVRRLARIVGEPHAQIGRAHV